MSYNEKLSQLRTHLYEKNINFLIGSGASFPFFKSLGNIEEKLSQIENIHLKRLVYYYYYKHCIKDNELLLNEENCCNYNVIKSYINFIRNLTSKMLRRNERISPKRANIFTTNYDVFFEKAINIVQKDNPSLIINDGGHGYFERYLSSDNFHKTVSKTGVFDHFYKELLTLNLIKCHGSVTWTKVNNKVENKLRILNNLEHMGSITQVFKSINIDLKEEEILHNFLKEDNDHSTTEELKAIANKYSTELEKFLKEYQNLQIINPEKSKFNNTVLKEHYYSMLRLLSYELERDQTVLIVFGFSFEDEHIRNLIKRSINNPSLLIYIFPYSIEGGTRIQELLNSRSNENIIIMGPEEVKKTDFDQFNKLLFGGYLDG